MKPIVLVGQSGSGKTTLGKAIATKLGASFCDLDQQLCETSGKSIEELLGQGEPEFRSLETAQLESALIAGYEVISTGGGAVLAEQNRHLLKQDALVIWLECEVADLASRLEGVNDRPLLDTEALVESLAEQRRGRLKYYFLASDARIDVTGKTVDETVPLVLEKVEELKEQSKIGASQVFVERVELGEGAGYEVVVGRGVIDRVKNYLPESAKRAVVVSQEGIDFNLDLGIDSKRIDIEVGEQAKRMETVERLNSSFSEFGMTRQDVVISLGGGVVTDVAGFAAATYHRGIKVIHIPTTLLGQVDAAIGGKCGVNLPEGKNLVGAFWQPEVVICDINTLASLPAEEFRNGLGEVAKYEFLLPTVEAAGASFGDLDSDFTELNLVEMVAIGARIKTFVVSADERESGMRAILNYGHTLAHAIESNSGYSGSHGMAVVKGLIFAAELARALGRIDTEKVTDHYAVAGRYGFDTRLRGEFSPEQLLDAMGRDKKALDGLTFVLDGDNGIEPLVVEDTQLVVDTISAMIAD